MDISYFKKLHRYGQDLIFDKFQTKLKCVLEDNNKNQFISINDICHSYVP